MSKVGRECGECEACCVVLEVPDIAKAAKVPCHLLNRTGPGCSLHGSKLQPHVCNTWQCLWRKGETSIDARPDHVGIIAYTGSDQILHLQETKNRAFKIYPQLKEEVLQISDHTGMNAQMIYFNGDKTLVIPKKNKKMYDMFDKLTTECEKVSNESK